MGKLYDQASEMSTLGVTKPSASQSRGRYGALDANVSKKPVAGYNKFNPSVLPPDQKARVDAYHLSRGKKK